jgi:predicted alpha/beta-hydrolase family hydrolase
VNYLTQDMRFLTRSIPVEPGIDIASTWVIPEQYRPGEDSAVILAHGTGSNMWHPLVVHIQLGLARLGLLTVTFNFPYRNTGRKLPDRGPILEKTWLAVMAAVHSTPELLPRKLFLGGKSMGGRAASIIAAKGEPCDGLILLGYPLHPPSQPTKLRVSHWPKIRSPMLFIQGTRDTLCQLEILKQNLERMTVPVTLYEVQRGNHSLLQPKSMAYKQEGVWREILEVTADWLRDL